MPLSISATSERDGPGSPAVAPLFLSSFAWNFTLGMSFVLIPLYAKFLGMDGISIGTLLSVPVVLQFACALMGGALTDRLGSKNMAMGACIATCISSMVFMFSATFSAMFAAQVVMALARGMFWPATWSLGSKLRGDTAAHMSHLNIATNAGQIVGAGAAGFILEWSTYFVGFAVMTGCAVGALVLNQVFKFEEGAAKVPPAPILATYRMLFRMRKIKYGIMCAYISALPVSLSFSFYPILFVEQGLGADIAGTLVSVRGVGAVTAGFVAGHLVRLFPGHALLNCLAAMAGASVILSAATGHPLATGGCLFALGFSTGVITTYFQTMVGAISTRETRGSAMALAGIGWSISHLTTPFIMGVLQEGTGTRAAFYVMGALTLLCSAALWWMRQWAFAPDYDETQQRQVHRKAHANRRTRPS